jgi:hypothetical protein
MRRILSFISVFALLLTACEGDPGPPGLDGLNGLDGVNIVAQSFEIVLDFTEENDYSFIEEYGPNFNILDSDVTLVYISWEVDNGQDIWRLLPQTEYFEDGNLVYNYDFTPVDVRFFLDGTVDFASLDSSYTQEQVFRVVVVPADNIGRLDLSDFEAVTSAYNITEFPRR